MSTGFWKSKSLSLVAEIENENPDSQSLESKINDEIDRKLEENRLQSSQRTFSGPTILYVGDDQSKKNELLESIRMQYFTEIQVESKEPDEPKAKIKEYLFDKSPFNFKIISMSNKPGEVGRWVKYFVIKSHMLIWVVSLLGILKDLDYLRENLEYFEKVQAIGSLRQTNFLIVINDSAPEDIDKQLKDMNGFPLTETERTTDVKVINELLEKAFSQRFEVKIQNSDFSRKIRFHYSHLLDKKIFLYIHSFLIDKSDQDK
ncbi:hypothetical protein RFI_15557 [Reticulomyxa filosa]|uniref:Uncharacterized protein n=1 Tax=Reticulomyxa filosa TaxID=46433 RepID=X6N7B2_RETFI|nr:hypothetical protein RFI_15557 [Reticulomyxa filosa]|eukprot:ETO21644.1 hypothetical protein RFI_15557 [Reticulomyxa filosa]